MLVTRRTAYFLLAVLVLIIAATVLLRPNFATAVRLPNPNGYDDFKSAGRLLTDFQYSSDLSELELRQIAAKNADALNIMRLGLDRQCRVPLTNSEQYIGDHLPDLTLIKKLAQALTIEGRVAELDGRTNDAARAYMDAIRLGQESVRGGVLIDALTGLASERIGSSRLEKILSALDADHCRALIKAMEAAESNSQPAAEVIRVEREWSHATYGVLARLRAMIAYRSWDPAAKACQTYPGKLDAERARQSQILIDLAARAYELENGRPPTNLNDLVPGFLKTTTGPNGHPGKRRRNICPGDERTSPHYALKATTAPYLQRPIIRRRTGTSRGGQSG